MSPQARAARFYNKFSSYKNFPPSRYRESGRGVGPPGKVKRSFPPVGVGPPEKFLTISPAPTPATGLVYRIFRDM